MTQLHPLPKDKLPKPSAKGKDEMNLAEFPIAKLGRQDKRDVIEYESWATDKKGERYQQKWIVSGSAQLGLPGEIANRIIVALLSIASEQNFDSPKISFTEYRLIKTLGLSTSNKNYEVIRKVLKQLVGITIYSEKAFWDNKRKKRVTHEKAFHIFEDLWLRHWKDTDDREDIDDKGQGYVVWSDTFWKSIKDGYIKNLDNEFYYSLKNPIARQLFRFLDKRIGQKKECEVDIFDLTGRLGMAKYAKPSHVKRKLQPGINEIIDRNYLASAEVVKVKRGDKTYTRIRFTKATATPSMWEGLAQESQTKNEEVTSEEKTPEENGQAPNQWQIIFEEHGTTDDQKDVWAKVLKELELTAGPAVFHTHLINTALLSTDGSEAVVGVANVAGKDWLQHQMERTIRNTLNAYLDTKIDALKFISIRDQMQQTIH